jgi:bifunctional non-homologous end joining protein LigD
MSQPRRTVPVPGTAAAPAGASAVRTATAVRASTPGAAKKSTQKSTTVAANQKGSFVPRIPEFVSPQLAKLVERPPNGAGWGHEVKFDGYRAELRVVDGKATFRTRNGLDWTSRFAAVAEDAGALPDCLIDGEVVALDKRRIPSFSALQAALSEKSSEALVYFAFDLLFQEHEDLRKLPLADRKARLERLLQTASVGERIRYVEHFESRADTVLQSACRMELEGIVSKRLEAAYISGRTDGWVKAKCRTGHEVVLGGWTSEGGQLRSLLAGVNRDGHLVYVGRIGTGYSREVAARLLPQLDTLTDAKSPFGGSNAPKKEKNVRWLKPKLVAEIEFAGWTGAGMIRQAAFKGLREDKPASSVVAETPVALGSEESVSEKLAEPSARQRARASRGAAQRSDTGPSAAQRPGTGPSAAHRAGTGRGSAQPARAAAARGAARSRPAGEGARGRRIAPPHAQALDSTVIMGVPISKPGKALWPDAGGEPVTKLDLARYFEEVGSWMLPHLQGRPCSLVRAPDGLAGQQFFQRHAMAGISTLFELVTVKGDHAPYVQIDRIEALAAVAQMGALEIHPWNCAPGDPDTAGRLVFDLDPAPDVKFAAVIEAALEMRGRLEAVGLISFCKTTGGKGLHVVTPLRDERKHGTEWPTAKNFARVICAQMAADSPRKYLDTMSKSQRVGRIFLDYLRNDRTATAVAPLSPRARAGATVSMPINWSDVDRKLNPTQFSVRTAPAILRKSKAWQEYERSAGSLQAAIGKITSTTAATKTSPTKTSIKTSTKTPVKTAAKTAARTAKGRNPR